MARVLAISSQVASGHVGLSAIVPALQALGHEVIALPTILLSNHPGHAHVAGERVAPDQLRRMADALDRNGWLAEVDGILTGYLPSAEHVAFAAETVDRLRVANARVTYLCDPVLGDDPKGLYIARDAAEAIRDQLIEKADVIKLNRFELEWLTGRRILAASDAADVVKAAMWPLTIATSVPSQAGMISNALIEQGRLRSVLDSRLYDDIPKGTGDLLSALLAGHVLKPGRSPLEAFERAIAGLLIAVARSRGAPELALISNLRAMARAIHAKPDARS